jgi:CHAD domain-containing protein
MRASILSPRTACTSSASAPAIEALVASLLEAGIASLRAGAQSMQDAATRRDPEIVHQARVSVRRMRTALGVFEALIRKCGPSGTLRRAQKALRRIARALGEARDWDVIQMSLLPAARAELAQHADADALSRLFRRAQLARVRANNAARRFAASAAFDEDLLRVEALQIALARSVSAGDPVPAIRALSRQSTRVLRLGEQLAGLDRRERHRFRIEVKRLRYAVEFCAPLLPAGNRNQWMRTLKGLQEVLGSMTDAWVLVDRVGPLATEHAIQSRFKARARAVAREQLPQAAALLMAWQLARAPWKI